MFAQAHDTDPGFMWLAKEVLETLETYYPGWSWQVSVRGGVLTIKSGAAAMYMQGYVKQAASLCFAIHVKNILHDSQVRKRKVIWAAGEWLERLNQKRGAMTDDAQNIKSIEGGKPTVLGGLLS
jgi:hypothetical protein